MEKATPRNPERMRAIYERSLDCVHCGLCLSACPTYRVTGRETSSPRGRIYLLRGVAEGALPLTSAVAEEAYLCLACRACETACPSGVQFGAIIELARAEVEDAGLRRGPAARIERLALRGLVPHRRRLRFALSLLAWAQRLGLDRLAARLAPQRLRDVIALAPRVPPRRQRGSLPEFVPAVGERRGRVGFFVGCVMPELFGAVNAATVRVLANNGFDVVIPREQGCCGALHVHSGDLEAARALARVNIAAFAATGVELVVVNSAGCGASMRDARHWLPGEGDELSARVRDVCEFLDEQGLRPPPGRVEAVVCYDDPCHLVHGQGVSDAPRRLLAQISGLVLEQHADSTACCGAAGIYSLTHREMSQAILARKLDSLGAVDPDIVASGNPGCLMQLRSGAQLRGMRARIAHPIELLDEAYL